MPIYKQVFHSITHLLLIGKTVTVVGHTSAARYHQLLTYSSKVLMILQYSIAANVTFHFPYNVPAADCPLFFYVIFCDQSQMPLVYC